MEHSGEKVFETGETAFLFGLLEFGADGPFRTGGLFHFACVVDHENVPVLEPAQH